ncbi:unnamed protein product [Lymnaea stagnalis]|uniref:VWFC domain-containing protein n=1 Tax=Lymnaea stagnalis TaxID=6523 RepID=A0AAV2HLF1_LYMST
MKAFLVSCIMLSLAGLMYAEDCVYNGVTYKDGETYEKGTCNPCYCDINPEVNCYDIQCGWPQCEDGAWPETKEGDCCPSCP